MSANQFLRCLYCLSHPQVTIEEAGKFNCLGIGIVNEDYDTSLMPGWDKESVGYHTDDGNIFHSTQGCDSDMETEGMETCQQDKTFETEVVDAYSAGQVRDRGEGGTVWESLIIKLKKYISLGSFYLTRFITRLTTYKIILLASRVLNPFQHCNNVFLPV